MHASRGWGGDYSRSSCLTPAERPLTTRLRGNGAPFLQERLPTAYISFIFCHRRPKKHSPLSNPPQLSPGHATFFLIPNIAIAFVSESHDSKASVPHASFFPGRLWKLLSLSLSLPCKGHCRATRMPPSHAFPHKPAKHPLPSCTMFLNRLRRSCKSTPPAHNLTVQLCGGIHQSVNGILSTLPLRLFIALCTLAVLPYAHLSSVFPALPWYPINGTYSGVQYHTTCHLFIITLLIILFS